MAKNEALEGRDRKLKTSEGEVITSQIARIQECVERKPRKGALYRGSCYGAKVASNAKR